LGLEGFDASNFYSYDPSGAPAPYGFFTTYTVNSALSELAVGGNIIVNGDFAPPILELVAPSGSISGGNLAFTGSRFGWLAGLPAQTAQVDLLAQMNITGFGVSMTAADFYGQIAFVATPTGYDYVGTLTNPVTTIGLDQVGNIHGQPSDLVQFNDPHTVHVYAVLGNLTQVILGSSERASIRAGLDIVQPIFDLENTAARDVSSVRAGRDITSAQPGVILGQNEFNIRVEGPGTIQVEAGRNILVQAGEYGTQGFGVASVGNTDNPIYLPDTAATNNIAAGVGANGPDLTNFINTYIAPAQGTSAAQNYLGLLTTYMSQQEGTILDAEQALSDFRALSPAEQMPFVEQVYFDEIKAGGESYAKTKIGYERSYKAIETLFPGTALGGTTTGYNGSISLYQLARIRSEQDGNISILVPGGGLTLGVENQTPDLTGQIDTARPGVLTLEGGNVNIFTDQSVVVAQSRIFTELGGDIMIWSTNGDINAGKGKQTSIVTSPPKILYDSFANVTKTPVTPQTGAGIATLIGVPGVPPGNVDLFAPHGTIDASQAGIRASGNLTVAALQVLNIANIQVRGTAVGIPTAVTPNTGALTAASNTAGSTVNTATEIAKQLTTTQQPDIPSIITVEVLGYGGG
jgi:filamentous hemagglutinin